MHTYRKQDDGWRVVFDLPGEKRTPLGPIFDFEWEAAAFASFLNGGRYCPDEIAPIFPKEYPEVTSDMHTYRKREAGAWQVVFDGEPIGPTWDEEFLAAAFACFLNGGRYSPGEIEPIFPKEYPEVTDDDSIHPDRPDFDYQLERKRG